MNILEKAIDFTKFLIFCYIYRILKLERTFTIQGKQYKYLYHLHGAWKKERAVEVPIGWNEVKNHKGKNILEVGNVLSHYYIIQHDVLDKYERQTGVINEDVVDFKPKKKYDLIVSLSTLEHVGYNECKEVQLIEKNKILLAIKNLKRCLAKGGKLVVTMPLGFNPSLDKKIWNEELGLDEEYYLKRISVSNRWVEIEKEDIKDIKFGQPYPKANGLFIGIFTNNDNINL